LHGAAPADGQAHARAGQQDGKGLWYPGWQGAVVSGLAGCNTGGSERRNRH